MLARLERRCCRIRLTASSSRLTPLERLALRFERVLHDLGVASALVLAGGGCDADAVDHRLVRVLEADAVERRRRLRFQAGDRQGGLVVAGSPFFAAASSVG